MTAKKNTTLRRTTAILVDHRSLASPPTFRFSPILVLYSVPPCLYFLPGFFYNGGTFLALDPSFVRLASPFACRVCPRPRWLRVRLYSSMNATSTHPPEPIPGLLDRCCPDRCFNAVQHEYIHKENSQLGWPAGGLSCPRRDAAPIIFLWMASTCGVFPSASSPDICMVLGSRSSFIQTKAPNYGSSPHRSPVWFLLRASR